MLADSERISSAIKDSRKYRKGSRKFAKQVHSCLDIILKKAEKLAPWFGHNIYFSKPQVCLFMNGILLKH